MYEITLREGINYTRKIVDSLERATQYILEKASELNLDVDYTPVFFEDINEDGVYMIEELWISADDRRQNENKRASVELYLIKLS
jgi:hypothetical protein